MEKQVKKKRSVQKRSDKNSANRENEGQKKPVSLLRMGAEALSGSGKKLRNTVRSGSMLNNLLLGLLFLTLFGLLLQQSYIFSLNREVSRLESERTRVQGEVDSKEGQLISSADIKTIESEARSYGMTEAKPSQYVYESYSQKNISTGQLPELYDYLAMFRQIRKDYLWRELPGEQ